MNDAPSQFHDAIRATGLEPPDVIEPDKLYRFPGIGKRNSNTAGWCKLFDDGMSGCFGDWSSGFSENWHAKQDKSFSRSERAAFMLRVSESRRQAEKELKAKQANAATRASTIWNETSPAPSNHPYLIHKAIKTNGARQYRGALVLPVIDFTGTLRSLQFIKPDGSKRLLSGGRKRGCFIPVTCNSADIANYAQYEHSTIIICEGWATGCTLAEDEPTALVLSSIDTGNLELVAVAARRRWPSAELVIAGDDDRLTEGNPGATKARIAAIAADALLALPQWPNGSPKTLTDFNDLANWLAGSDE